MAIYPVFVLENSAIFARTGWPTASRLLLDRVKPSQLGWYWGLISLAGNVGASVAPIAMALLCDYYAEQGWKAIFFAGGGAAVLIGLAVDLVLQMGAPVPPTSEAKKPTSAARSRSSSRRSKSPAAKKRPASSPSPAARKKTAPLRKSQHLAVLKTHFPARVG